MLRARKQTKRMKIIFIIVKNQLGMMFVNTLILFLRTCTIRGGHIRKNKRGNDDGS